MVCKLFNWRNSPLGHCPRRGRALPGSNSALAYRRGFSWPGVGGACPVHCPWPPARLCTVYLLPTCSWLLDTLRMHLPTSPAGALQTPRPTVTLGAKVAVCRLCARLAIYSPSQLPCPGPWPRVPLAATAPTPPAIVPIDPGPRVAKVPCTPKLPRRSETTCPAVLSTTGRRGSTLSTPPSWPPETSPCLRVLHTPSRPRARPVCLLDAREPWGSAHPSHRILDDARR